MSRSLNATTLGYLRAMTFMMMWGSVVAADQTTVNQIPPHLRFQTTVPDPVTASTVRRGTAVSPSGERLGVNARWFTRNDQPFYPVMGEIHFSRVPADQWEDAILAMKAGGITVISNYVFWLHHEEERGRFEWDGVRDLHAFVALCAKHHMQVWLRIGPWCHGEARNGGFPDWLKSACKPRSMDPAYFDLVRIWYQQVFAQVRGFMHKDGGPIIGVQLDNEFGHCGGEGGGPHILKLKQLAKEIGFDVPYYSVTGWGGAWVPEDEVLPTQGSYADNFWSGGHQRLAPPKELLFGDIGTLISQTVVGSDQAKRLANDHHLRYDPARYPYSTAEVGGGMQITHRRRPLMDPRDTLTMAQARIGEGANNLGYYMYHGGTNPEGRLSTLQETGWSPLPVLSYDFQAPLGEYGKTQGAYPQLRRLHRFLSVCGADLATMPPGIPEARITNPVDPRLRTAVRSDGTRGFLFFSNHHRYVDLPAQTDIQWSIRLANQTLIIPSSPITIPAHAVGIVPINLPLADGTLVYALGQPVFRDAESLVLAAHGSIPMEVSLRGVKPPLGARQYGDQWVITLVPNQPLRVTTNAGATVTLMGLSERDSLAAVAVRLQDRERLAICDQADVWQNGKDLVVRTTTSDSALSVALYPALSAPLQIATSTVSMTNDGVFSRLNIPLPTVTTPTVTLRTSSVPASDSAYDLKPMGPPQAWSVDLGTMDWRASDLILNLPYQGDMARLYLNGQLVADHLWYGPTWQVGLRRWQAFLGKPGATLTWVVTPWKRDQPTMVDQLPTLTGDLTLNVGTPRITVERSVKLTP